MTFSPSSRIHILLVLVICIMLLSVQTEKVFGLRSLELTRRHGKEDHRFLHEDQHTTLKAKAKGKMNSANSNGFDPNQWSKRRVRKGSDPIHNRA
ncbi:hypothetical protein HN51_037745 [Arachis hypogaea]